MQFDFIHIALICHETNKAFCDSIGDSTQQHWYQAKEWQRQSAIKGVEFAINNPGAPASAQHEAWMRDKEADGWTWGPVKDAAKKEHPCLVPYDELPREQRIKDHLFRGVVKAFTDVE